MQTTKALLNEIDYLKSLRTAKEAEIDRLKSLVTALITDQIAKAFKQGYAAGYDDVERGDPRYAGLDWWLEQYLKQVKIDISSYRMGGEYQRL